MTVIDPATRQRVKARLDSGDVRPGTPEWVQLCRTLLTGNPADTPETVEVGEVEPAAYPDGGSPIIGGDDSSPGGRLTDSIALARR